MTVSEAVVELSTPSGPLVVRPIEPTDVDALLRLYEGLSPEDRQRRFFSPFVPDRAFAVREAGSGGSEGHELVAEHAGEIVAVAGWTPLPDGDGELAMTVSRPWRGWLGPFLLDTLVRAAGERGVRNLQADVLVLNRPMLGLLRSRGSATMSHPDSGVVRLAIGVGAATPGWPPADPRPRVLVEVRGSHWRAEDAAIANGLRLMACPGPERGCGRAGCPAVRGDPCPLARAADAIVVPHPPSDPGWDALRGRHLELHPGVPVLVDVGADGALVDGEVAIPAGDEGAIAGFVARRAVAHERSRRSEPSSATGQGRAIRHGGRERCVPPR